MGLPSLRSKGAHQARSCRAGQRHVPDLRGHAGLHQFAGQVRPSPAGTAVLEIARKIADELGSVPLNANRRALVGYLSMLEG